MILAEEVVYLPLFVPSLPTWPLLTRSWPSGKEVDCRPCGRRFDSGRAFSLPFCFSRRSRIVGGPGSGLSGKKSEDTYEADILILCASSHAVTALLAAIHLRSFAVSRLGIGSFANFCVRFHAARSRTSGAVFRKTCAAAVALSSKCSASGWSGMSAQAASSRPAYGGAGTFGGGRKPDGTTTGGERGSEAWSTGSSGDPVQDSSSCCCAGGAAAAKAGWRHMGHLYP